MIARFSTRSFHDATQAGCPHAELPIPPVGLRAIRKLGFSASSCRETPDADIWPVAGNRSYPTPSCRRIHRELTVQSHIRADVSCSGPALRGTFHGRQQ